MVLFLRRAFLSLALFALCGLGTANAILVTFDGGSLVTITPSLSVYTENGLQFAIYGTAPDFITNTHDATQGNALMINLNNDIIITRVGGETFSLDSFDFLGGSFSAWGGFHGDLICGGENALTCQSVRPAGADIGYLLELGGFTTIHPVLDNAAWGNIDAIDWCGYCVAGDATGNSIDNLSFSVPQSVPEPASIAVFASALFGLGLIGRRKNRS